MTGVAVVVYFKSETPLNHAAAATLVGGSFMPFAIGGLGAMG